MVFWFVMYSYFVYKVIWFTIVEKITIKSIGLISQYLSTSSYIDRDNSRSLFDMTFVY